MHRFRISLLATVLSLATFFSCAGIFKGMRSASTTTVNRAPYYAGKLKTPPTRIGHLPVTFDRELQTNLFDRDRKQAVQPILDEMNAFLDKLGASRPLPGVNLPIDEAPYIYVGSEAGSHSPTDVMNDDESGPDMMTPEDIDRFLNSERREDLPGQPLAWQAALQNLIAQLTGEKDLLVE